MSDIPAFVEQLADLAKFEAQQEYAAQVQEWKDKLLISSRRADAAEVEAAKWRAAGEAAEAKAAALVQSVQDLAASLRPEE